MSMRPKHSLDRLLTLKASDVHADPVSEQQDKAPVVIRPAALIPIVATGLLAPVVIRPAALIPIVATGLSCRDQDDRRALQSLLSGKLLRADGGWNESGRRHA